MELLLELALLAAGVVGILVLIGKQIPKTRLTLRKIMSPSPAKFSVHKTILSRYGIYTTPSTRRKLPQ